MVRPRSTTSKSPYLPGLIQFGPYIAGYVGVIRPWRSVGGRIGVGLGKQIQFGLFMITMSPLIFWCQARITCFASLVLGIMPCSIW